MHEENLQVPADIESVILRDVEYYMVNNGVIEKAPLGQYKLCAKKEPFYKKDGFKRVFYPLLVALILWLMAEGYSKLRVKAEKQKSEQSPKVK